MVVMRSIWTQGGIVFDAKEFLEPFKVLSLAHERLDQGMLDCKRLAVRSSDERLNGAVFHVIEPADL